MSLKPFNHNADLKQLLDEGYEVEVYKGHLLIHDIPYVNSKREVVRGTIVSILETSGDSIRFKDHVAHWVGDHPCNSEGAPLSNLVNNSNIRVEIREGLIATHSFSQKPKSDGQYRDHHHKMTTYINYLEVEAQVLKPGVTAKTFARVFPLED
ncbi:MAG: ThiF family adenylyltransferase, partial [Patescibacteria group bacterium]|nr:ThiF family adenylyltransferase [Patescibacteria group bacterium]